MTRNRPQCHIWRGPVPERQIIRQVCDTRFHPTPDDCPLKFDPDHEVELRGEAEYGPTDREIIHGHVLRTY